MLGLEEILTSYTFIPKDAVHVVTALPAHAAQLDTFDRRLKRFSEQVGGDPVLRIGRPGLPLQGVLWKPEDSQPPPSEEDVEDEADEEE